MEEDQLVTRSRAEILHQIDDYIVMEVDGNVVGCVAVHFYPEENKAELACLFVKKGHTDQGYGRALVSAAIAEAKETRASEIFALSTQAAGYLEREGFERVDDLNALPESRRDKWKENGRNALLLIRPA